MTRVSNRYAHLDHASVPIGVQTFLLAVGKTKDLSLQYQMHQAVGSVAVTIYGTNEQSTRRLKSGATVIDPDTLPDIWFELPTQFATSPIVTVSTELLPIADEPDGYVAVRVEATVLAPEFSLISNSKTA